MKAPARPKVSERELQGVVIDLAHTLGWKVAHFRSVATRRPDGSVRYMTPVQADGAGFPDLVLVRRDRILFVELKAQRGQLETAQLDWLGALRFAGAETHVWKPAHYFAGDIERTLA